MIADARAFRLPTPPPPGWRATAAARLVTASTVMSADAGPATPGGDKPAMQVGDAWTFRVSGGPGPAREWTEQVVEVLEHGRYRAHVEGHALPWVEFDGPGNVAQPAPWPTLQLLQFPLTLGKHWTNSVADTPVQRRTVDYRVVAVERLKLRVGEFDCLRLDGHETTSVDTAAVVSRGTIFYCPALRHIGLRETRIPDVGLVRQEIVAYRVASASRTSSIPTRPAIP